MKMILYLILIVFLVTFGWGWYRDVYNGSMSLDRYAYHYFQSVQSNAQSLTYQTQRLFKGLSGQIKRPELKLVE